MFGLFKYKQPFRATMFFPGDFPPHPQHWEFLRAAGFEVGKHEKESSNAHWALKVKHPEWGSGAIVRFKDVHFPPDELIQYSLGLTLRDKLEIRKFRCLLTYVADGSDSAQPVERKKHFRMIRAIMGEQSDYMIDNVSDLYWSRASLDDELAHDAELGLDALYSMQAVGLESGRCWLHTHGLAKMGYFDFDVVDLDPGAHILVDLETIRGMVSQIIQGFLKAPVDVYDMTSPSRKFSLVSAKDFNNAVGEAVAGLLRPDHENGHDDKRFVVCDPLRGWFFRKKIRPCSWIGLQDMGVGMVHYTAEATDTMQERARKTYPTLKKYFPYAEKHELIVIVKMGYETKSGSKEHMWFKVHGLAEDSIDATLLNQPFDIDGMNEGDRGRHEVSRLTDWKIMTPVGDADAQNVYRLREFMEIINR